MSKVEDCAPGEAEFVRWVRAYARHGNSIDPVRVRIRRNNHDLHSFILHVPEETVETPHDKALSLALQLLGDPNMRAGLIHTLTVALRPLAEGIIRPVVLASLQEILEEPTVETCNPLSPHSSNPTIPISTPSPEKASA